MPVQFFVCTVILEIIGDRETGKFENILENIFVLLEYSFFEETDLLII
jgi:hypothetical protein